ncbi:MAG: hypothetical protein ACLVLA_13605 [Acidaminococcus intestini]
MDVQKVTVRVPATSANCGPGFDCLGLACSLYNVFTFERIPQGIEVSGVGEGAEILPLGRHNLAVSSFMHYGRNIRERKRESASQASYTYLYQGGSEAVRRL